MKSQNNEQYYKKNSKYTNFLDSQNTSDFDKYVDFVAKLSKKGDRFLDIGCGTGIALTMLGKNIKGIGVEISNTSIEKCLEKKLDCQVYDGKKLPFQGNSFEIVGSYNVLEHTDSPLDFLAEQKRVLKSLGYLIVICPNFLSITNSYHHHTAGTKQKLANLQEIIKKSMNSTIEIGKMKTIDREDFHPDDNACNVTNPIDIIKWAKKNRFDLKYWSSRSTYRPGISNLIDISFLKVLLGSSFLVSEKR